MLCAVRFGGYPEVTRAMADAIYGGAAVEATIGTETIRLQAMVKRYRRQFSHDGVYAVATLLANDEESSCQGAEEAEEQTTMEPRQCYLFCPSGDRERLFEELDHKTAAPLIPAFRDYVLDTLIGRRELRPLRVLSLREKLDAWVLELQPEDRNIVTILEEGLHSGAIAIPGATPNADDGFSQVDGVTSYLNTFGVTVADRIRNQFLPLFDPAAEPLSPEILQVNDHIQKTTGYSLYDAQLAVAEAVKRQPLPRPWDTAPLPTQHLHQEKAAGACWRSALRRTARVQQRQRSGRRHGRTVCRFPLLRRHDRHTHQRLQLWYLSSAVSYCPQPYAERWQRVPQARRL